MMPKRRSIIWKGVHVCLGACLLGICFAATGCQLDPVSKAKIKDREDRMAHTIKLMKQSEARHPEKLRYRMRDISETEARKRAQFRETMRTLGDRFW